MAIKAEDIYESIVNSFNGKKLCEHPKIRRLVKINSHNEKVKNEILKDENRPFVCVGHNKNISQWAEITTQKHDLYIKPEDRTWEDGDSAHKLTS